MCVCVCVCVFYVKSNGYQWGTGQSSNFLFGWCCCPIISKRYTVRDVSTAPLELRWGRLRYFVRRSKVTRWRGDTGDIPLVVELNPFDSISDYDWSNTADYSPPLNWMATLCAKGQRSCDDVTADVTLAAIFRCGFDQSHKKNWSKLLQRKSGQDQRANVFHSILNDNNNNNNDNDNSNNNFEKW